MKAAGAKGCLLNSALWLIAACEVATLKNEDLKKLPTSQGAAVEDAPWRHFRTAGDSRHVPNVTSLQVYNTEGDSSNNFAISPPDGVPLHQFPGSAEEFQQTPFQNHGVKKQRSGAEQIPSATYHVRNASSSPSALLSDRHFPSSKEREVQEEKLDSVLQSPTPLLKKQQDHADTGKKHLAHRKAKEKTSRVRVISGPWTSEEEVKESSEDSQRIVTSAQFPDSPPLPVKPFGEGSREVKFSDSLPVQGRNEILLHSDIRPPVQTEERGRHEHLRRPTSRKHAAVDTERSQVQNDGLLLDLSNPPDTSRHAPRPSTSVRRNLDGMDRGDLALSHAPADSDALSRLRRTGGKQRRYLDGDSGVVPDGERNGKGRGRGARLKGKSGDRQGRRNKGRRKPVDDITLVPTDDLEKELVAVAEKSNKRRKGKKPGSKLSGESNGTSPKRIRQHMEHKKKVRDWLQRRVQEQINQRRMRRDLIM